MLSITLALTSSSFCLAMDSALLKTLKVGESFLNIRQYFECIGVIPPDHDTSVPYIEIPQVTEVQNVDPFLVSHLKMNTKDRDGIDTKLDTLYAFIDWEKLQPQATTLQINTKLERCTPHFDQLVREWETTIQTYFQELQSDFEHQEIDLLTDAWSETVQEVRKNVKTTSDFHIYEVPEQSTLHVYGAKSLVLEGMEQIEKLKEKIVAELERQQKTVTETLTWSVSEIKFMMINNIQYSVREASPSLLLDVDEENNIIILKGLPNEICMQSVSC